MAVESELSFQELLNRHYATDRQIQHLYNKYKTSPGESRIRVFQELMSKLIASRVWKEKRDVAFFKLILLEADNLRLMAERSERDAEISKAMLEYLTNLTKKIKIESFFETRRMNYVRRKIIVLYRCVKRHKKNVERLIRAMRGKKEQTKIIGLEKARREKQQQASMARQFKKKKAA